MANKKEDKNEQVITPKIDTSQIKAELIEFIKNQASIEVDNQVLEKEKKYIRSKNRKIVFLEITIFFLIAIIIGSFIFLYNDHYFDKFRKNYSPDECQKLVDEKCSIKKDNENNEEEPKEEPKPTLEELIAKYNGIFDNIKITTKNNYLVDFYGEKYTDELKLSMVTDLINLNDVVDADSVIIDSEKINDMSKKLFANDLNLVTYYYNNVELHYYKKLDKFVAADTIVEGTIIKRDIVGIEERENSVFITTEEYYEEDGLALSPLTNTEGKEKKTYEFILKNEKYILNV